MSTFVALYRGPSVSEARLVAVSSDAGLIRDVTARLINPLYADDEASADPVIRSIDQGKRNALKHILREVNRGE